MHGAEGEAGSRSGDNVRPETTSMRMNRREMKTLSRAPKRPVRTLNCDSRHAEHTDPIIQDECVSDAKANQHLRPLETRLRPTERVVGKEHRQTGGRT